MQATDVAAWVAGWKGALQAFADDVSATVQAAKAGNVDALRSVLGKIPGDAQEVMSKLGDPVTAPGGLGEDVRRLDLLVNQAAATTGQIGTACLGGTPGAACLADVAALVGLVAQFNDAMQPFGVHIDFHVGS